MYTYDININPYVDVDNMIYTIYRIWARAPSFLLGILMSLVVLSSNSRDPLLGHRINSKLLKLTNKTWFLWVMFIFGWVLCLIILGLGILNSSLVFDQIMGSGGFNTL